LYLHAENSAQISRRSFFNSGIGIHGDCNANAENSSGLGIGYADDLSVKGATFFTCSLSKKLKSLRLQTKRSFRMLLAWHQRVERQSLSSLLLKRNCIHFHPLELSPAKVFSQS
jgi:hypothetical protein